MENLLNEAAEIADREPEDNVQGRVELMLITGRVIRGRVIGVHNGLFIFEEVDPNGDLYDFVRHIRVESIIQFAYSD